MRNCGILMPISSLAGSQGMGTLGKPAHDFVDFLVQAGQGVWQILPVAPTGYGDSPYQSCSAFAGNPYFIDLELLEEDGLLKKKDYASLKWGEDPAQVDYALLYEKRYPVLEKAFETWKTQRPVLGWDTPFSDDWYAFVFRNESWLEDYALYMAVKEANGMKHWLEWPRELRTRQPQALEQFRQKNADRILFWKFLQYEFDKQWRALKEYANESGIKIMGDIPIYVSADSADAWTGGRLFELDGEGRPARVAGCPPDYFSADGQLWGNPLYDWNYHRQTGFAWWIQRVRHSMGIYDLLRIDHFRGFDTYWAIPANASTAREGKWEQGPGMELFNALKTALAPEGSLPIIAEDLGELFDSCRRLLKESGFPGMKVLQFAFGGTDSEYLPHNHIQNSVVYTGTHDNTTAAHWLKEAGSRKEVANARKYLNLDRKDPVRGMIRAAIASCADLAIIPMADWLELGEEARLNTPGKLGGNWAWRVEAEALTPALAKEIRDLNALYFRVQPPKAAADPQEKE